MKCKHTHKFTPPAFVFLIILTLFADVKAQSIEGYIRDKNTNVPLPNITVEVSPKNNPLAVGSVLSNTSGFYQLNNISTSINNEKQEADKLYLHYDHTYIQAEISTSIPLKKATLYQINGQALSTATFVQSGSQHYKVTLPLNHNLNQVLLFSDGRHQTVKFIPWALPRHKPGPIELKNKSSQLKSVGTPYVFKLSDVSSGQYKSIQLEKNIDPNGVNKLDFLLEEKYVSPTTDNPYPQGVFILRSLGSGNYELDFKHASGTTIDKVFQIGNEGKSISGFTITDIIPHSSGYLIFANLDNGSGGLLYFTNLKLKILKELALEKCNVVANRYARLGSILYYTNISDINEVNQPTNKSYIIDIDKQTLQKIDLQVKQFFTTGSGELYYNDIVNGLYKVNNLNSLSAYFVTDFNDYSSNFIMDNQDRLWSTFMSRQPNGISDFVAVSRGVFNYQLHLLCYDILTNKKNEEIISETINKDSQLLINSAGKLNVITNQNTHITNAKKTLWEFYYEGDKVEYNHVMDLPKNKTSLVATNDINIYQLVSDEVIVFGNGSDVAAPSGSKTYYYEINLAQKNTTRKNLGIYRLFERQPF
ncbi:MAG: hypothetical protein N4A71_16955 [Carboxylicivirga sp.]|jgi:hypothetical protein|nr:hypothetical protein [Carboxylicivirga sp.]